MSGMKLHTLLVIAGAFLLHKADGKPQQVESLPVVARGSNVYGVGAGFNDEPPAFPVTGEVLPPIIPVQPLPNRQRGPPRRQPSPVGPPPAVVSNAIQPVQRQPAAGNRPGVGLEDIDLTITDLTRRPQPPVGVGGNQLGGGPAAAGRPPRPQVVGSAGRGPGLDDILTSVPPAAAQGGVLGVGADRDGQQVALAFERNSAQAAGEEGYGAEHEKPAGYPQEERRVVARGGDTYGQGGGVEVPRGDLNIQPEEPRKKERILSQAAEPEAPSPSVRPQASPPANPPAPPPSQDEGQGHHMGGIEWLPESIPGEPLVDYPVLARIPESSTFDCNDMEVDGFYADTSSDARCQAFWVCHNDKQDGFLCPNGTMFHQRYFTCDWWFNVNCEESPEYFDLNRNIGVVGTRIDTVPAGVVAAESKVHPVFTLLSEMLRYPLVLPVPPDIKNKSSHKPSSGPSAGSNFSTVITNSNQTDTQVENIHIEVSEQDRKSSESKNSQRNLTSPNNRFIDPRTKHVPVQSRSPQSQVKGQQALDSQAPQAADPEGYIESVERVHIPMSAVTNASQMETDLKLLGKGGSKLFSPSSEQAGSANSASSSFGVPGPSQGQVPPPPPPQPQIQTPSSLAQQPAQPGGLSSAVVNPAQSPLVPPNRPPMQDPAQLSSVTSSEQASNNKAGAGRVISQQSIVEIAFEDTSNSSTTEQTSSTSTTEATTAVLEDPAALEGVNITITNETASEPPNLPSLQGQNTDQVNLVVDEDIKLNNGGPSSPTEPKNRPPPESAPSVNQGSGSNGGQSPTVDEYMVVNKGGSAPPVVEQLHYPPSGSSPAIGPEPALSGGAPHGKRDVAFQAGSGASAQNSFSGHSRGTREPSEEVSDWISGDVDSEESFESSQHAEDMTIKTESVSRIMEKPKRSQSSLPDRLSGISRDPRESLDEETVWISNNGVFGKGFESSRNAQDIKIKTESVSRVLPKPKRSQLSLPNSVSGNSRDVRENHDKDDEWTSNDDDSENSLDAQDLRIKTESVSRILEKPKRSYSSTLKSYRGPSRGPRESSDDDNDRISDETSSEEDFDNLEHADDINIKTESISRILEKPKRSNPSLQNVFGSHSRDARKSSDEDSDSTFEEAGSLKDFESLEHSDDINIKTESISRILEKPKRSYSFLPNSISTHSRAARKSSDEDSNLIPDNADSEEDFRSSDHAEDINIKTESISRILEKPKRSYSSVPNSISTHSRGTRESSDEYSDSVSDDAESGEDFGSLEHAEDINIKTESISRILEKPKRSYSSLEDSFNAHTRSARESADEYSDLISNGADSEESFDSSEHAEDINIKTESVSRILEKPKRSYYTPQNSFSGHYRGARESLDQVSDSTSNDADSNKGLGSSQLTQNIKAKTESVGSIFEKPKRSFHLQHDPSGFQPSSLDNSRKVAAKRLSTEIETAKKVYKIPEKNKDEKVMNPEAQSYAGQRREATGDEGNISDENKFYPHLQTISNMRPDMLLSDFSPYLSDIIQRQVPLGGVGMERQASPVMMEESKQYQMMQKPSAQAISEQKTPFNVAPYPAPDDRNFENRQAPVGINLNFLIGPQPLNGSFGSDSTESQKRKRSSPSATGSHSLEPASHTSLSVSGDYEYDLSDLPKWMQKTNRAMRNADLLFSKNEIYPLASNINFVISPHPISESLKSDLSESKRVKRSLLSATRSVESVDHITGSLNDVYEYDLSDLPAWMQRANTGKRSAGSPLTENEIDPIEANLNFIISSQSMSRPFEGDSFDFKKVKRSLPAAIRSFETTGHASPFLSDAYEYDLSDLPTWMLRANAGKRNADSPLPEEENYPIETNPNLMINSDVVSKSFGSESFESKKAKRTLPSVRSIESVDHASLYDAYEYDLSDLPTWMKRTNAGKRNADSPLPENGIYPLGTNLNFVITSRKIGGSLETGSADYKKVKRSLPSATRSAKAVGQVTDTLNDSYDYDLSDLPTWMQRANAGKRNTDSALLENGNYPMVASLNSVFNQEFNSGSSGSDSFVSEKAKRSSQSGKIVQFVEPVVHATDALNEAYEYDLSDLPTWMQRANAGKRSADSPVSQNAPESIANKPARDQRAIPAQLSLSQETSRPVRKVVLKHGSQLKSIKRALAAPHIKSVFDSARKNLMNILGGPKDVLDSGDSNSFLHKSTKDKSKREDEIKLRLDSSSLTSLFGLE